MFDHEWESDFLREFTRKIISSESLNNETDSKDKVSTFTIPLPGLEVNYDDIMKMVTSLRNFALAKNSRYYLRSRN